MKRALVVLALTFFGSSSAVCQESGRISWLDTAGFDRTVRPQDDFYSFVNGGWITKTVIPADREYVSFVDLEARTASTLRRIVEQVAITGGPRGTTRQLIGDFYATLLDSASIEKAGAKPLAPFLAEIDRLRDIGELPTIFARLGNFGVRRPILAVVIQDPKDSDRYALTLRQWGLGLPNRALYLANDSNSLRMRRAYEGHIRSILTIAGAANAPDDAARVVKVETLLAQAHWSPARNRDPTAIYNKLSLAQLQSLAPTFDWTNHFRALGLPGVTTVIVRQPSYVAAVDTILRQTTIADWKSYLRFHLVSTAARRNALSHAFTKEYFDFNSAVLSGVLDTPPRWKRALDATEESLGDALGRLYVEQEFSPARRARAEAVVHTVMDAFRAGINELDWMSDSTKVRAKAKLERFRLKVGYPDRWKDYRSLEVRRGDALGNAFRTTKFYYDDLFQRLGKPVAKDEWFTSPQTVNAFNNLGRHELVLPAAILQPPVFDERADDALNFAAIGATIGHEIAHAFDDQGRHYDGDGNLRDWWTADDAKAFRQRADLLVDQYNRYSPLPGIFVNGRQTLGENIADLNGLTTAYRAYRLSLRGKEAPVIGGFTGDQRFFLAAAQGGRSVGREQALRTHLLSDSHAPDMYRVNGVLVNFDPFYAAWNVKPGDRMYLPPEQRVRIW